MVRYSFLFFIVFLIGLLPVFSAQAATSVIPGWHTTIYAPWSLLAISQILWIGIVSVIYSFLEKKGRTLDKKFFLPHIFLSLSVFMNNYFTLFDSGYISGNRMIAPLFMFVLGQIIFAIGVLKAKTHTSLE